MPANELSLYDVFYVRYGYCQVEAANEAEARRKALSDVQEDDISWDETWGIDTMSEVKEDTYEL